MRPDIGLQRGEGVRVRDECDDLALQRKLLSIQAFISVDEQVLVSQHGTIHQKNEWINNSKRLGSCQPEMLLMFAKAEK